MARAGFSIKVNLTKTGFRKACFLGMGGSAAGGDIIGSWLHDRPMFETATFKGQLTRESMADTLAIACSASGQTQETIEMMKASVRRGATTVSISAGGRLMDVSKKCGVQHVMMPQVVAPRYMLPFIIFSCLSIINKGLGMGCEDEAEDAIREMEHEGRSVAITTPASTNPSKQIALSMLRKTPVIYCSRTTLGVGVRFKNALNENAKRHAIVGELPDAFHNEIEAWDSERGGFVPVFLTHTSDTEQMLKKVHTMQKILTELRANPIEISGRGKSSLAQLVTMVFRLDMASYYVSVGIGRDPFPTRLIDRIKEKS